MNITPARVWITRAEPGAARTAARLRDIGLEPVVAPLLAIVNLTPPVPDLAPFTALAFTSINGVTGSPSRATAAQGERLFGWIVIDQSFSHAIGKDH